MSTVINPEENTLVLDEALLVPSLEARQGLVISWIRSVDLCNLAISGAVRSVPIQHLFDVGYRGYGEAIN